MEDCLHRKGTLMRKVFVTLLLSVVSLFAYGSERMGQDTQIWDFHRITNIPNYDTLANFGQLCKVNIWLL